MPNAMLHPLMLCIQAVLYDIAESCDFHFPNDDAFRQVKRGLIQLRLQQKRLEPLLSLEAKSCYHLILAICSSICT